MFWHCSYLFISIFLIHSAIKSKSTWKPPTCKLRMMIYMTALSVMKLERDLQKIKNKDQSSSSVTGCAGYTYKQWIFLTYILFPCVDVKSFIIRLCTKSEKGQKLVPLWETCFGCKLQKFTRDSAYRRRAEFRTFPGATLFDKYL